MDRRSGSKAQEGSPADPIDRTGAAAGAAASDQGGERTRDRERARVAAEEDGGSAARPAAVSRGVTALVERVRAVRGRSLALAEPLSPEDCQPQSMPDASPVKWHLGHTTWFFDTFLLAPRGGAVAPGWSEIFNSYYVRIGPRHARPQRGLLTRPSLDEVRAYRAEVDARLEQLVPDAGEHELERLELGLNHEQQHQELVLMDLLHLFSSSSIEPRYGSRSAADGDAAGDAPGAGRIEVDAGLHEVGRAAGDPRFAYDNESPRHRVFLEPFALATRPVSCAEYRAFVEDDGYARPELWMSDGWDAVQREGWSAPLYWRREEDGAWTRFGLDGRHALEGAEPVQHLSWYEADAYARWAAEREHGARLPREHEWEVAVRRGFDAWASDADEDPRLVGSPDDQRRAIRLRPRAMTNARVEPGDGWEWTSSDYTAYPGFRTERGAVGEYNGKFMSGQLVLRGASFATPPGHSRPTYRNFFWHTARWPFTQLRLAFDD